MGYFMSRFRQKNFFACHQDLVPINQDSEKNDSTPPVTTSKGPPPDQRCHHVANLLVSLAKAELEWSGICRVLLNTYDSKQCLKLLKELPEFQTAEALARALTSPCTLAEEILLLLCNTYGDSFKIASGNRELEVPGFSKDVKQFVVTMQLNPQRYTQFKKEMKKKKNKSKLLFHGTVAEAVLPILLNGFIPSKDVRLGKGNFMAEEPITSYGYAFAYAHLKRDDPFKKWRTRATTSQGVLLGCQVAGKGRLVSDVSEKSGPVHVITNLESIAIRYLFVLPQLSFETASEFWKSPSYADAMRSAPKRKVLKDFMLKAFDEQFPPVDNELKKDETPVIVQPSPNICTRNEREKLQRWLKWWTSGTSESPEKQKHC